MGFFFKQKTAYEMRISDWSSDVCCSDLDAHPGGLAGTVRANQPGQAAVAYLRAEVLQGRRAAEMLVQTIDDNRDITGPIRWRVRYCATGQPVSCLWCARRRLVRHRPRWSPACTGEAPHLRWFRQSAPDRPKIGRDTGREGVCPDLE